MIDVRGVGPTQKRALAEYGISTIADLVWLLPIGYDDLGSALGVAEAVGRADDRERLVIVARVKTAGLAFVRRRRAVRIELQDVSSSGAPGITAWWFFMARDVLDQARPGRELVFVGRLTPKKRGAGATLIHPEIADPAGVRIRPRYPKIGGVGADRLRSIVRAAVETAPDTPAPVPPSIAARESFSKIDFLKVHAVSATPTYDDVEGAREQIAWAEAFAQSFQRAEIESWTKLRPAEALPENREALEKLRVALGFEWTGAQARAIEEISQDLAATRPMRRLLQGDVGSGKTAVALAAIAQAIAAGRQALVFAPTTPLADQYTQVIRELERELGWRSATLTGTTPAAERRELGRRAHDRTLDLLVATHALLSEGVRLPALSVAVVDEQQRLGVAQRLGVLGLGAENRSVHLLTLSATPIPRTLALALRGELDQSELDELPPGRHPIETELVPRSRWRERAIPEIGAALASGESVFVVCPRIGDDDDLSDGPAAVERAAELSAELGAELVVLVHGRLPAAELRAGLDAFRQKKKRVLVGTTVVEVGLDVPHATRMIVDGAEFFGMAEIHQLRGRVGRSSLRSRCLLVYSEPLSELARRRLDALATTELGSEVARLDLELRGGGDLDGTRQSGQTDLDLVERYANASWLARIPADVAELRAADPNLELAEHRQLAVFVERALRRLALREEAG